MRNVLIIWAIFCLSSCVIKPDIAPTPVVENVTVDFSPFPIRPELKEYSRKPIIDSTEDNNFIVSDEFVENSILLKKYNDKIDIWKSKNKIK